MTLNVDITITPGQNGSLRCTGTVDESSEATNPAESVAAWLGSLDPQEVERVALDRQRLSDGSYTAVVLATLGRWARGDA